MIFAAGLFIFVIAILVTVGQRPEPAGVWVATFGLMGIVLMLLSICMLVARWMP